MTKNIIIRHHMLNARLMGLGGSQYVMLETAIAFAERGFETYIESLLITSTCDLLKIAEFFGIPKKELVNIGIGGPSSNNAFIINTSGDVFSGPGDVVYLHYPSFLEYAVYYNRLNGLFDIAGKTYSLINTILFPFLTRRVKIYIANSTFTALFFKGTFGIDPYIIYPPVNIDDIVNREILPFEEREKYVLTVTRISPEKHPELVLQVAKYVKKHGLRVLMVGALSEYNKPLYDAIIERAVKENVDDVLDIYVNIPRSKLIDLYRKSMIYIHITPREHFGISIVEAMATGTPVIIPENSGSWIDIAQRNPNTARSYREIEEIPCIIKEIINNNNHWNQLSINGYKRALQLSREQYRKKLYHIVKPLIFQLSP